MYIIIVKEAFVFEIVTFLSKIKCSETTVTIKFSANDNELLHGIILRILLLFSVLFKPNT